MLEYILLAEKEKEKNYGVVLNSNSLYYQTVMNILRASRVNTLGRPRPRITDLIACPKLEAEESKHQMLSMDLKLE